MPAVRLPLVALATLALAAGLAACGGSGGATSTGATGVATTVSGATTTSPAPKPAAAPPGDDNAPGGASCQAQLGAFVGSMDSLRRRLAVGVTYEQYVDEVHAVRETYGKVDAGSVEIDCLAAVGTPAEKAFNRYIEAANDWGGCVSEAGCESADIEPVLQRQWRIAAHFLGEAREGLGESG